MLLTPGTRLGPYEIVAPLGAGGMGEVFRAKDPSDATMALSLRGDCVMFVGMKDDDGALGLRRFDSFDAVRLAKTEAATMSCFSPDGTRLAFFARGRLGRIDLPGRVAVELASSIERLPQHDAQRVTPLGTRRLRAIEPRVASRPRDPKDAAPCRHRHGTWYPPLAGCPRDRGEPGPHAQGGSETFSDEIPELVMHTCTRACGAHRPLRHSRRTAASRLRGPALAAPAPWSRLG